MTPSLADLASSPACAGRIAKGMGGERPDGRTPALGGGLPKHTHAPLQMLRYDGVFAGATAQMRSWPKGCGGAEPGLPSPSLPLPSPPWPRCALRSAISLRSLSFSVRNASADSTLE